MMGPLLLSGLALAGDCSAVPPTSEFIVSVGHGDDTSSARADAHRSLRAQVCTAYSKTRCDQVSALVRDWTLGETADGRPCAVAAVRRSVLASLEQDVDRMRVDAAALAERALDEVGVAVRLPPATWSAGTKTSAAVAGAAEAELRMALVESGVGVTSDAPDELMVRLSPVAGGTRVTVQAGSGVGLGGFMLPSELVDPDAVPLTSSGAWVHGVLPNGREEAHWIDGCTSLGGVEVFASQVAGLLSQWHRRERNAAAREVGARMAKLRVACHRYEGFQLGEEGYLHEESDARAWLEQRRVEWTPGEQATAMGTVSLTVEARVEGAGTIDTGDTVNTGDVVVVTARRVGGDFLWLEYANLAGEWAVVPLGTAPTATRRFRVDGAAGLERVRVFAADSPDASLYAVAGRAARRGLVLIPEPVPDADAVPVELDGDRGGRATGDGMASYSLVLRHLD